MEWAIMPLKRYAEFSGRSRRKEYWLFLLLAIGLGIVAGIIDGILGLRHGSVGPIGGLLSLALLIPSIAVAIRRLHDTDRSGWWLVIACTGVGVLPLLYWQYQPGTPGTNRFGPNPEEATD